MVQLAEHPTVKNFFEREGISSGPDQPFPLDTEALRQLCLEAGGGAAVPS